MAMYLLGFDKQETERRDWRDSRRSHLQGKERETGLAWLGGTHGGPIYRAERGGLGLAGHMAVPSTGQREREAGLAWRDSWRSHLQGREREGRALAWRDSWQSHLQGKERERRAWLGGTHGGPIYRAKRERERRAWLGGTHGGPIYRAKRERERRAWLGLAGLMAVPSTGQRESESRASLAWRDSWRSHLQGKQRVRVGRTWLGLAGLVAVPSTGQRERESGELGLAWLGGTRDGPIYRAKRESRAWLGLA